jgi:hypothetical protein
MQDLAPTVIPYEENPLSPVSLVLLQHRVWGIVRFLPLPPAGEGTFPPRGFPNMHYGAW